MEFHVAPAEAPNAEDWFVPGDGLSAAELADISEDRGSRRVVNLDLIGANYRAARTMAGKDVIAVVKARAYGAGLVPVGKRLMKEGCTAFAVASLGAGLALRRELGAAPMILVLGYTPPEGLLKAARERISLTLTDDDDLWPVYEAELQRRTPGLPIHFHMNLDTGMTRVGIPAHSAERVIKMAETIQDAPWATLQGLYTHFASADSPRAESPDDEALTLTQIRLFEDRFKDLQGQGVSPQFVHLANSPALEQYSEAVEPTWITHVRPGSVLHGMGLDDTPFRRATRWETTLVRVEQLAKDTGVGYGHKYRAKAGQYIGTLPVGYADGFMPPQTHEPNVVRIDDVLVPVVSLAMDMCMVDLGPYVQKKGAPPDVSRTVVTLISDAASPEPLSAESVAERWGQHWAIALSGIRTRNTRVYTSAAP